MCRNHGPTNGRKRGKSRGWASRRHHNMGTRRHPQARRIPRRNGHRTTKARHNGHNSPALHADADAPRPVAAHVAAHADVVADVVAQICSWSDFQAIKVHLAKKIKTFDILKIHHKYLRLCQNGNRRSPLMAETASPTGTKRTEELLNFIFSKIFTSPVAILSGEVFSPGEKSRKVDSPYRACVSLPLPRF